MVKNNHAQKRHGGEAEDRDVAQQRALRGSPERLAGDVRCVLVILKHMGARKVGKSIGSEKKKPHQRMKDDLSAYCGILI